MIETKGRELDTLTIFNAVPGCYLVLLPDTPRYSIIAVTDSYLNATYAKRDEIIGLGVFQAFPANTDTLRTNGISNLMASLDYVVANKKAHKMPNQRYDTFNQKSGKYELKVWSPENIPVLNSKGKLEYIIHSVKDITEQLVKEATEKAVNVPSHSNKDLQVEKEPIETKGKYGAIEGNKELVENILNNSPSGITVSEVIRNEHNEVIDARTIVANQMSEKFTGIPQELLLEKTLKQIDPHLFDSELYQQGLSTLKTGENFAAQYYLNPTGKWLELAVSKMDEDHLINVFTDITDVKEAQIQLENYVEELKKSNANLEEFAYAASHDLKEPIRKINYFADRLRSKLVGKMDQEDLHYFTRMEFAAKRMANLIDDLLVYSHVSKGAELTERIDLNQKLQMVLSDLELQIHEKNADVKVGELPVIIGHRRQMQQLFQNLISNSIKYSKPGVPPVITINSEKVKGSETPLQLTPEDASKYYNLIEIRDNGIGFEQADADRIFNVFTRLQTSAEYRGTGIGLSIARKVVQNHNGFIWADSTPDVGSVFRILLPVTGI